MPHFSRIRRSAIPVAGFLVAATALAGLTGCQQSSAGSKPAATTAAPSADFGGTDLAWIEINIAMDEELEPLLALVPHQSKNAQVLALTKQVQGFTGTELTALRQLHDAAQLPAQNPHEGMPMPGMVTPDQVTAAKKLSGAAFDKLIVDQIKAHCEQGQNLAQSEEKAGVEPRTRALATSVIHTRTQTLGSLKE